MSFLAGTASSNITPPLGVRLAGSYLPRTAEDVVDDLHAKAVAVSDGTTSVALVVCDLIALSRDRMDQAKERAERMSGIPASNILISCTHTHSGPAPCWVLGVAPEDGYLDWACLKIADAVTLAARRMREARAGAAVGTVPDQVFNRRWWMKDGTVRMNPGFQSADLVKPAGPTDQQFTILAIETTDGSPLALFANYALHYVGSGASNVLSADYFGMFGRTMKRMMDADLLAVMANGCSGDINNHDYGVPRHPLSSVPRAKTRQVAEVCAAEATRLWHETVAMAADVPVGVVSEEVKVRKRHIPEDELAEARAAEAAGGDLKDREFFWKWQKLRVSELSDAFPTQLQALRIGDLGVVGLPGEIFVEIGLQIKDGSPFPCTMPVSLANGYLGYTCTDKALREGSYETQVAYSSLPAAGTEGLYVETCARLLNQLHEA